MFEDINIFIQDMFEDDDDVDDVLADDVVVENEDMEVDIINAGATSNEEDAAFKLSDDRDSQIGQKRKAISPIDLNPSLETLPSNLMAEAVHSEDSNASLKFRIKPIKVSL